MHLLETHVYSKLFSGSSCLQYVVYSLQTNDNVAFPFAHRVSASWDFRALTFLSFFVFCYVGSGILYFEVFYFFGILGFRVLGFSGFRVFGYLGIWVLWFLGFRGFAFLGLWVY